MAGVENSVELCHKTMSANNAKRNHCGATEHQDQSGKNVKRVQNLAWELDPLFDYQSVRTCHTGLQIDNVPNHLPKGGLPEISQHGGQATKVHTSADMLTQI